MFQVLGVSLDSPAEFVLCWTADGEASGRTGQALRIAASHGLPVVPVAGNTGLTGATWTDGGVMLSVERLNRIREVRPDARVAIVEAGVILSRLHDAAAEHGLYFPLWFGARGSAMIGGVLSTNAGGSNVLRYGSTRALCLGLEVVLADGRVLNLMSELHKDNSGYDLKQMFIGAEGTLGVITAAVMKLVPAPRAYATATLAARSLPDALIREVMEETGLSIAVGPPALINEFHDPDRGFHQVDLFFRCTIIGGQMTESRTSPAEE